MPEQSESHDEEKIERLRRAMYSRSLSEKLKERQRRPLRETDPVVGEDWRHPEPVLPASIVAPRMIGVARKALFWLLGLAVLFFIGAVGFFAYYFTIGGGALPASPTNIDITITGPPQVAGGEPTELQIAVTNRNQVALELADLVISYPQGTRAVSDLPQNDVHLCSSREGATSTPYVLERQRICLGTIESGGTRQGTVHAIFSGSGGQHADVKVELEYRLAGSSAIFAAQSNYEMVFSSSPLAISIESNEQTVSGQPTELTATVSSNANTIVKDVLFSATYPFGFAFRSADPPPKQGSVWELGDLSPGERRPIVIRGILSGESGDERVFRFAAGTRKDPALPAIDTSFADASFKMQVSQAFLGLTISANKATGSGVVVSPGDNVNVSIAWQNNVTTAISDAVIVARLTGVQIDGTTVRTTDGFFRSSDNAVLWDKTTTGGVLSDLPPDAKGTVSFSFQMPPSDALKFISNPQLIITVSAAGKRVSESGVPENLQASATQAIGIASDLSLTAQGLYYANPFVSVGPLPPAAGVETTYALIFTITNTTNKIAGAKLTAVLPPYVRWIGVYRPVSENVTFNQSNGTLQWDIGDIDPNVGMNGTPPRQVAIPIGLTPSTAQIGQEPALVQQIRLSGKDAATGNTITRAINDVTTDLARVSKSSANIPVGIDPGFTSAKATVVTK